MKKIFEVTDNTETTYAFLTAKINRLELHGTNLRVALNNEIIRLSYDTETQAEAAYKNIYTIIEEYQQ